MSTRGSVKQDKKRGTWYFVVDLPTADGRRQVKRRGFASRKAAIDELDVLLGNVKTGTYVEPSKLALQTYLDGWLDGLTAAGRRPSTIDGYRRLLKAYVFETDLGATKLQAVTALDLDRLYARLATSGRRRAKDGHPGLSLRTVRYVHTVLGKAFADAVRQGLMQRNPARLANPPKTSSTRAPEFTVWSPAELQKFLKHTGEHDHRHLFRVAALTGLRRGELCGLRWVDVDLDAARLHVRQSITPVGGKPVVGEAKSARSRRSIDLDAGTVAALKAHRKDQAAEKLLMGAAYRDKGLVFATATGAVWHPDTISGVFESAVKESKLPRIRLHDLRHGHATHLLAAGTNPKIVSERLGHASVAFTLDTYGHVLPGQQASAAAAVAALVGG
jgi:integrase